jgi:Leucine-rich repeat (LRR) protein
MKSISSNAELRKILAIALIIALILGTGFTTMVDAPVIEPLDDDQEPNGIVDIIDTMGAFDPVIDDDPYDCDDVDYCDDFDCADCNPWLCDDCGEGMMTCLCCAACDDGCELCDPSLYGCEDCGICFACIGDDESFTPPVEATSATDVISFPDPYFEALVRQTINKPSGDIYSGDVENITTLRIWDSSVANLTGIGYFTALDHLEVVNTPITSLDVSNNTALTVLIIGSNQLKSLDLSDNTALRRLSVGENLLTSLKISNNIALTELSVSNIPLASLDISNNTALRMLSINETLLTSLDVSNIALISLLVFDTPLDSLDLSNNTALTELRVLGTSLESLDVSNNIALLRLIVGGKQLTSLDVKNNTALTVLSVSNTQLTSLDLSNNMALTSLSIYGNQLTSLDLSNNMALTYLSIYGNQLTSLGVSNNTALTWLNVLNTQLTSLDLSNNMALTNLSVHDTKLTSLDLSNNMALTYLSIYGNQLTSLDVSNNTALNVLNVSNTQLTSLDVSKNTALTSLTANNNRLTSLDVKNTNLFSLMVDNNDLTLLDLSKNTNLVELYASNNMLTELDLSNNVALTTVDISGNKLTELDISNNRELRILMVRWNYFANTNKITGLAANNFDEITLFYKDSLEFGCCCYGRFNFVNHFLPQNTIGAIPDNKITDALEQDEPLIKIEEGESTVISEDALQAIKDSEGTLTIVLPNGREITIRGEDISDNPKSIDLNFDVVITSSATAVYGVNVPANSVVIIPEASGEFGFTFSFTISAAELAAAGLNGNTVGLFHISSAGVITNRANQQLRRNSDGSVTLSLSSASRCVLSSTPPIRTGGAPQMGDERTLIFSIIAIALGSIGIIGRVMHIAKDKSTKVIAKTNRNGLKKVAVAKR